MAPPNTRHGSTAARRPGACRKDVAEQPLRIAANPPPARALWYNPPYLFAVGCKERIWRSWA